MGGDMAGRTAFLYHDDYLGYNFGPSHPLKPKRYEDTLELLQNLGIFDDMVKHYQPPRASEEDLMLVHSQEYIQRVKRQCEKGAGYLDYGDTPARRGIYEASCAKVGGSILGADLIMRGDVNHAFNVGGGLHHATRDSAAGFCVFNDVAIAARHLQQRHDLERIAIVDVDGHHGDGTQRIFYKEPILTISLHRYGGGFLGRFYPGTGTVDEIGEGAGKGYSVNVPLPVGTFNEAYLEAFNEIVPPLLEEYEPEILLNQFGVDTHYQDPLVGLALTTKSYVEVSSVLHHLAHEFSSGRYLIFGGGGYEPSNVSRCWAAMFITVAGVRAKNEDVYRELFDREMKYQNPEISRRVRKIIKDVKNTVFPIHGL
ncbi:MAG: acetoin utilization protein AcuC [Candidatus Bathyarchaeota archaeon]|nr:MAG: acetoin utilization protein AcuC [Candidatus Bathyarchaeota archaeon]